MTTPVSRRMIELPGTEALWLLESAAQGQLVYVRDEVPAEMITDPDETGHYRRTLHSWAHGPHDTLVRIRPQTVAGFRLAHAEAAR